MFYFCAMKKILVVYLLLLSSLGLAQKHHFWDGIESFDGPTDNNPLLAAQIDYYFDKMVSPLPDSIKLEINRLAEITNYQTDLRDFFLWHLLERYRHPEFMSQDEIFVFLYDNYFSKLKIKDLNDDNLALIREKAERLRRLALFCPAPEIHVEGIDLQSIESEYTVLYFYDHDCDLCRQETRDLDSVCVAHPEIVVISIDMNRDNPSELLSLTEAYDIKTTPFIYVLGRDKRIIAKKIQARQIPLILD
jgi:hypothetical protein